MSTLTKILIILLTLSSLVLCGSVGSYVGFAENYKKKYNELKNDRDSLSNKVKDLTKQINEKIAQGQELEKKLNEQIASLEATSKELDVNLKNSEREKSALLQQVNSYVSITKDFYATNDKQGQLLKNTLAELNRVQGEQIKQKKDLDETSAKLLEKMAIIETLEDKTKRLMEEKTELQSRLDQLLQPIGKIASETVPVTPEKGAAQPAIPVTKDISLKGLISEVDLKNSIASISIGSADGVKEGMRFHVVRGEEFVCDILIINVDVERSVGVLELVQQVPKVGDSVSTNL